VDNWVEQIRALVDRASSLEQIADELLALVPQMSVEQYAAAMRQAMIAAQLAGRYDVLEAFGGVG
jgi:phage gp29-like protein